MIRTHKPIGHFWTAASLYQQKEQYRVFSFPDSRLPVEDPLTPNSEDDMAPSERSSKRRRVENLADGLMEGETINLSSARPANPVSGAHLDRETQSLLADVSRSSDSINSEDPKTIWLESDDIVDPVRRSKRSHQDSNAHEEQQKGSSKKKQLPARGKYGLEYTASQQSKTQSVPCAVPDNSSKVQKRSVKTRDKSSLDDIAKPTTATHSRAVRKNGARSVRDSKNPVGRANAKVSLKSTKQKPMTTGDLSDDSEIEKRSEVTADGQASHKNATKRSKATDFAQNGEEEIAAQAARFRSTAGYGAQFASTYIADELESELQANVSNPDPAPKQSVKTKGRNKRRSGSNKEPESTSQPIHSEKPSMVSLPSHDKQKIASNVDSSVQSLPLEPAGLDSPIPEEAETLHRPRYIQQHSDFPMRQPRAYPHTSTSDYYLAQALDVQQRPSWGPVNQSAPREPTPGPIDEKRYTPPPMNEEQASMMGSFSIFEKGFSPSEAALSMLGRSKKLNKAKQTGAPSISNPGRPEGWVPCHPGRGPMSQDDPRRAIDPKLPRDQQKRMTAFRIELNKPKPLYTEVNSPSNDGSPFLMRKRTDTPDAARRNESISEPVEPNQEPALKSETDHKVSETDQTHSDMDQPAFPAKAGEAGTEGPHASNAASSPIEEERTEIAPSTIAAVETFNPTAPANSYSHNPTILPTELMEQAAGRVESNGPLDGLLASVMRSTETTSLGYRQTDMTYQPSPATIYNPTPGPEAQSIANFIGRIVKDAQGNNVQETPIPVAHPFREFELSFNDASGKEVNIALNDQLVNTVLKDRGPGDSAHATKERLRRELLMSGAVITDTTSQAEASHFYEVNTSAIQRYKNILNGTASASEPDQLPPLFTKRSAGQKSDRGTEDPSTSVFPAKSPAQKSTSVPDAVPGFRPINADGWPGTQTLLLRAQHDLLSSPNNRTSPARSEGHATLSSPRPRTSKDVNDTTVNTPTLQENSAKQHMTEERVPRSTVERPRDMAFLSKSTSRAEDTSTSEPSPRVSGVGAKASAFDTPSNAKKDRQRKSKESKSKQKASLGSALSATPASKSKGAQKKAKQKVGNAARKLALAGSPHTQDGQGGSGEDEEEGDTIVVGSMASNSS